LSATGAIAGTYGSTSQIPQIQVDAKGRIISITTVAAASAGGGITALSGDVTASGSGTQAATLAVSGVTAATYGSATQVPQIAVDAKGRITSASNLTITASGGGMTSLTGDITGSGSGAVNTTLSISGVTAAVYGSASAIPAITVDAKGRITTATTNTLNNTNIGTTVIEKTAAYTLTALSEANTMIRFNAGSAVNFTIPTNATLAFPVGTSILVQQTGANANQVTVVGASGVTIQSAGDKYKTNQQYSVLTVIKVASPDTWVVAGDVV
jgi:hypothetical protein